MGQVGNSIFSSLVFLSVIIWQSEAFADEERCKDDSFCRAYCLSTNPDTVSARCGRDLQSCICITPYNQAVKVRFIEERHPVPPTLPTTPRPVRQAGVQYVNSQVMPEGHSNNYNGNGNSIAGNQYQQHLQPVPQDPLTPVLLECDASESSTRMCHLFCTMEIRAWYGLCNITSKACACFGIPASAVQKEPIAAIFHSTAPVTTPPPTTPRPAPPPRHIQPQPYPQQPQQFQPHPQQQWRPIPSSQHQQTPYNNYPYQPSPSVLNPAPQTNQLQDQNQSPVRSVASLFGSNGKPVSPSILTPAASPIEATPGQDNTGSSVPISSFSEGTSELPATEGNTEGIPASTLASTLRKRRSLNDTPLAKEKGNPADKDLSMKGDCTKYKCGIACKRNNYFAPDCKPKCVDGECWCECFPRL